jgi:hypothetical protein
MPAFLLGRDQVSTIPGVVNDDIESVEIKVDGDELEATVFKATPLTSADVLTQVGLVEVAFECTCTHHSATIGLKGPAVVGKIDTDDLEAEAVVVDIKRTVTPKGRQGYVISYAIAHPAA